MQIRRLVRVLWFLSITCQTAYGADIKFWLLGSHNSKDSLVDEKITLGTTVEITLGQSRSVEQETLFQLGFDYCQEHNICFGLRIFHNTSYAESGYETFGSSAYSASLSTTLVEQLIGPSLGYGGDWFYVGVTLISHYGYDLTYNFNTSDDSISSPIPDGKISLKTGGEIYQVAFMAGEAIKLGALIQYESLVSETSLAQEIYGDTYKSIEAARIQRFVHYLGAYMSL